MENLKTDLELSQENHFIWFDLDILFEIITIDRDCFFLLFFFFRYTTETHALFYVKMSD